MMLLSAVGDKTIAQISKVAMLVEQARDGIAGPHGQLISQETRPARQPALAGITRNATITQIVKSCQNQWVGQ